MSAGRPRNICGALRGGGQELTSIGRQGDVAAVFVPHQVTHCDSVEVEKKTGEVGLLRKLRRLGPGPVREAGRGERARGSAALVLNEAGEREARTRRAGEDGRAGGPASTARPRRRDWRKEEEGRRKGGGGNARSVGPLQVLASSASYNA